MTTSTRHFFVIDMKGCIDGTDCKNAWKNSIEALKLIEEIEKDERDVYIDALLSMKMLVVRYATLAGMSRRLETDREYRPTND